MVSGTEADFLENMSWGSKLSVKVSQRNFLQKLVRQGKCTPEVSLLASRVIGGSNSDSDLWRQEAWEVKILKERIRNKEGEIIMARRRLSRSSWFLRRKTTQEIYADFMAIRQTELERVWKSEG